MYSTNIDLGDYNTLSMHRKLSEQKKDDCHQNVLTVMEISKLHSTATKASWQADQQSDWPKTSASLNDTGQVIIAHPQPTELSGTATAGNAWTKKCVCYTRSQRQDTYGQVINLWATIKQGKGRKVSGRCTEVRWHYNQVHRHTALRGRGRGWREQEIRKGTKGRNKSHQYNS